MSHTEYCDCGSCIVAEAISGLDFNVELDSFDPTDSLYSHLRNFLLQDSTRRVILAPAANKVTWTTPQYTGKPLELGSTYEVFAWLRMIDLLRGVGAQWFTVTDHAEGIVIQAKPEGNR